MKYTVRVIPGRGDGRKLGWPTLNVQIPPDLKADYGVYAGWVRIQDHGPEKYPAAIHYGPVPSFGISKISLEAHVIGKNIATTPKEITLELVEYIREIKNFQDINDLRTAIKSDTEKAVNVFMRL